VCTHITRTQLILPLNSFFPPDDDGNSALPQLSPLALLYHNTPDKHSLAFLVCCVVAVCARV
jgi:hypothetical protein